MRHEITSNESSFLNIRELFQYRELFFILAYRDFKIKYAQTFLGVAWAFFQPLVTILIFTLIFDKAIGVRTGNIPYPLFALSGICAWNYFSYVMTQGGGSIIGAQSIISKIYFPRLIIPFSKAFFGLMDLIIVFIFFIGLLVFYSFIPPKTIIYLPIYLLLLILLSNGAAIWISALTIRFRDLQYALPFLSQVGLYLTPVAYPGTLIPEKYQVLYHLNPMAGIVEGFRWCLTGYPGPGLATTITTSVIIGLFFISGVFYFKKVEQIIPDIV